MKQPFGIGKGNTAHYKLSLIEAADELEGMCSCYDTHHKVCICGSERLAKKLRISAGIENGDLK